MKTWIIAIVVVLAAGAAGYFLLGRSRSPAESALLADARRGFAACPSPATPGPAPDGATATKEQMVSARRAAADFDQAITAYSQCLKSVEQRIRDGHREVSAAADLQQAGRLMTERNNAAIDRDQQVANQVNVELRKFKARNN